MKQNLLTRVQAAFLAVAVMLSMTVPTFGANASDISVTLNKNALILEKNGTETLTVTVRNGESTVASPNVYFLSSDTHVVEVTERTGVVTAKGGGTGKLFGAVTNDAIASALKAKSGIALDKRKIVISDPIKNVGTYTVQCKLGYEITAPLTVKIEEA